MKTCRAIAGIADQFIKWPTIEECAELASQYRLAETIGTINIGTTLKKYLL